MPRMAPPTVLPGGRCISLLYNEISPSRMMPEGRRQVGHPNLFRDRSPEMIQDPIQFAPGVRPHPYSLQKIQNQKKKQRFRTSWG